MKTSAKIILYFAIVMFVLSLSSVLHAVGPAMEALKGVELNDGTVIHGKIIDMNIDRVIIDIKDGNRVSVKFDDVYRFLINEPAEKYQRVEESADSVMHAHGPAMKALKGVELNDGTVIHGKILDMNIDRVIIDKQDGNRVSVKFDDVYHFLIDEQAERYQIVEESASPAPIVMSERKAAEKATILEAVKAIILEDVHFDFDKATLKTEAQTILKRNVKLLKDNPKAKVRIAGCTSASGTDEYNQRLSERRAEAVKEYLIREGVTTPDRLSTIGYGKTKPAAHEADPKDLYSKAAMANMRVLFEIIDK